MVFFTYILSYTVTEHASSFWKRHREISTLEPLLWCNSSMLLYVLNCCSLKKEQIKIQEKTEVFSEFLQYIAVAFQLWSWPRRGSTRLCLPSYYKSEWKNIILNIFKTLQNIFISNNGIRNILDSKFRTGVYASCRSQWPRGLRHELSSLSRMLGSWVRIPLKAWMSVCVYSMFMLFCV
jgi:hypothetical protein